jgi:hypothetical protein
LEARIGEEVHRKGKAITNRCIICRGTLTAKRKDASYCSARCRQRSHRSVTSTITDIIPDKPLSLLPIGSRSANEFIKDHHRHNKEVGFGPRYAVVDKSGEIWGAAIVSRPVTRMLNHGGYTAELRRVCTKQASRMRQCVAAPCSTQRAGERGRRWVVTEWSLTPCKRNLGRRSRHQDGDGKLRARDRK